VKVAHQLFQRYRVEIALAGNVLQADQVG